MNVERISVNNNNSSTTVVDKRSFQLHICVSAYALCWKFVRYGSPHSSGVEGSKDLILGGDWAGMKDGCIVI